MTDAPDVPELVDPLEALRRRIVGLADVVIDRLEHDLTRGTVAQRNAAIKLIAPYLMRTLDSVNEQDQYDELRGALGELLTEMRNG